MRKLMLLLAACCALGTAQGQHIFNTGSGDSLYPVTNRLMEYPGGFNHRTYQEGTSVFGMTKAQSTYYLVGDFTHLAPNHGSALVVDTNSSTVLNAGKWRVDGLVKTAIPDGQGGFYIGGSFSRIGDSLRRNLAQVDAAGKPTAWRADADSVVNTLLRRNDTLFIGGAFRNINSAPRHCFAMYALGSNGLLANGSAFSFTLMGAINSLLLVRDTIVYGGADHSNGNRSIRKYSFKNDSHLAWQLAFNDFAEVRQMALSADSATLIYGGYYNGEFIKGVNYATGTQRYFINVSMYWPESPTSGSVLGLGVLGNKAYAAGNFEHVLPSLGGTLNRKGFFAFNPHTGAVFNDNLNLDWYPSFLLTRGNKLYLSGLFNTVNGTPRTHFAAVDTGTLQLNALQFAPSDALTALAFSGNNAYVAGTFSGIYAVRRNGFAAIDSATRAVLPWSPVNTEFRENRRMMVRGDSLFVFGWKSRWNTNCIIEPFTLLKIYNRHTGIEYSVPNALASLRIADCVIDGNYLYVTQNRRLQRYVLPSLTLDAGWGYTWLSPANEHQPNHIVVDSHKVYTVGDTRYRYICNGFGPKRAILGVYSKTTGVMESWYPYEGTNPDYDQPRFERAVLSGDRLFVQGIFDKLNGQTRRNFAALNVTTGALTPWQTTFGRTEYNQGGLVFNGFEFTSELKIYNGRLWVGADITRLTDGSTFPGFGAIDTVSGALTTPFSVRTSVYSEAPVYSNRGARAFVLGDDELTLAGSFDSVNARAYTNFARFNFNPANPVAVSVCSGSSISMASQLGGSSYQWQVNNGSGFVNIANGGTYSGATGPTLTISDIPESFANYQFRAVVNGTPTVPYFLALNIAPQPATITAAGTTTFCQGGSVLLSSSATGQRNQWYRNGNMVPNAAAVSYAATLTGSYTVRVLQDGCYSQASNVIDVTAHPAPLVGVFANTPALCSGNSTQVFASGASTYSWSPATGLNATTGPSVTATPATTTTYTVTGTANGCSASQNVTISVTPSVTPTINITYTGCPSGTIVFNATTTNLAGGTVQWYRNNIPMNTGNSFTVTGATNGTQVYARLTSGAVCANPQSVNSQTVTLSCITVTAVPNIEGVEDFRLAPNPTPGPLQVLLRLNTAKKVSFEILDATGSVLRTVPPALLSGSASRRLDLGALPQGLYYLRTTIGGRSFLEKVIVQR
ncbi:T9SS type A sorting domain-containing protein [Flaviaesturariibacter amylovorans]|uniref:T9SS type A sorting domain-containing protein n=1 Tax=Flaviaesturariibacter amylovorans TaxID=1084520 RepID=A0ABP8HMD5_9BACT